MPVVSPTLPNDGETVDAQDVNGPFNAILSALNGNIDAANVKPGSLAWSVMQSFTNSIPAAAMQDSGNLEKFRSETSLSMVASGFVWSLVSGLNGQMTAGVLYATNGNRIAVNAISSQAFTASKDTYVSVTSSGGLAYDPQTNGAAQPALPAGNKWVAKVVTNGSTITSVSDMRSTGLINSTNIDWTEFGGMQRQVLGRSILTTAGDTLTATITPARRILHVEAYVIPSSTIDVYTYFNGNQSAGQYGFRFDANNGTLSTSGSATKIPVNATSAAIPKFITYDICDIAGAEKLMHGITTDIGAAGTGNVPLRAEYSGKFIVTTDRITSVSLINTAAGDLGVGSFIIVSGED